VNLSYIIKQQFLKENMAGNKFNNKNEQGMVLLLALILMASAVIIGLGMAHVIIQDLRQSILVDNSITAYYAAESALEKSLFEVRVFETPLGSLPTSGILDNDAEWTLDWSSGRPDVTVNIQKEQTYQLDLFNPDVLDEPAGIEALRFSWDGPGQLEVAYIGWTPAASIIWPHDEYQVVTPPISFVNPAVIYDALSAGQAYRIRLKAVGGDIQNLNITGWADDGATPGNQVDLPSHITLEANGEYGFARQALSAIIPRHAQLSGIWDFVLFSEEEITKE